MNSKVIEILDSGPDLRLVSSMANKDMFYGYPFGGVMDYKSSLAVNSILGKSASSKLIECSLKGCELMFKEDLNLCIAGAEMGWRIDDVEIDSYKKYTIKKGQTLKGGYARKGLRSYIGFSYDIDKIVENNIYLSNELTIQKQSKNYNTNFELNEQLEVDRGPEWYLLDQGSKEQLINFEGSITKDLSRMGVYLKSQPITLKGEFPTQSVCIFPGVIQLLPNGQLLVLTQDAQTTGGYPRVAYFDKENLCDFNQLGIGHKLQWRLLL